MEIIEIKKEDNKIDCYICLKKYNKKYRNRHEKTQHHILSKQIINNLNFKHFEFLNKF
jgi:hypothetical protein